MRHGQAANKLDDPQRGLTPHGKADIERLAYSLAARGMHFEHTIYSSRARAEQTALIMRETISPKSTASMKDNLSPGDDPHILLAELDDWLEDTLVTGHLPFMPSLVSLLTDHNSAVSAIDFEPGTVVCLLRDEENNWSMEWVSSPSML
jgi:phosphohistidine phosphatase